MPKSARLTADTLSFRYAAAGSGTTETLIQLSADDANPGTGMFSTQGSGRVLLTGIEMPTDPSGIASKAYVDSIAQGLTIKGEVSYVTIGPIFETGSTYVYDAGTEKTTITGAKAWDLIDSTQIDIGPRVNDGSSTRTIAWARADGFFNRTSSNDGVKGHTSFVARDNEHYYPSREGDLTSPGVTNYGSRTYWPTRILVNAEEDP